MEAGRSAGGGRRKWWAAASAALLLVAAAAGAYIVTRSDTGRGAVDTSQAADQLRQLGDDVNLETLDGADVEFASLGDGCELLTFSRLIKRLPDDVSLDEVADDEVGQAAFRQGDNDDPVVFSCTQGADEQIGVAVGAAPDGDYDDYLDRALDSLDVTFEDESPLEGGTLRTYCFDYPESPDSCAGDWTDGDVQITLYGTVVDDGQAAEWMTAALPKILDELVDLDADDIEFPEES